MPEKIQVANTLWNDTNWVCEEKYTGYRCIFELFGDRNRLSLFNWKYYGDKLRDVSNYFPLFSTIKTSIPNTDIDVLLIPPSSTNKTFLNTIFLNGPMGAEKLQDKEGKVELIFLDILSYKSVDLKGLPWSERRVYLEAAYNEIKTGFDENKATVLLSKVIKEHKREYFNWLCENKSKGVILKDKTCGYVSGFGRNFMEVKNINGFKENISLKTVWADQPKNDSFDFDHYLAMTTLDNIKLD